MSDEALAWKIAFGALVLAFCGMAYFMRAPSHPVELARSAPAPKVAPVSAPLPAFEIIPPDVSDVPDAQDPPEAQEAKAAEEAQVGIPVPAAKETPKHRKSARRVPASKVHLVKHRPRSSPYASGRKHYPFDPKERWLGRYA